MDTDIEKPLSYKDELRKANELMALDPRICFVGYGVKIGGRAGGSLKNIPEAQLLEMPVAENLMASFAIGLALKGRIPVVYIERMDFILNALDAIVNHLDKAKRISEGEFSPRVIIRALVGGSKKPLYTGATHVQDFSEGVATMVSFPVVRLLAAEDIKDGFREAHCRAAVDDGKSTLLVEYKDLL